MDIRDQSALQIVGHTVSLGTLMSVITGLLPVVASLVALIWYIIQIFESDTWCRRTERRRRKRIAELRGELATLETLTTLADITDTAGDAVKSTPPRKH